MDIKLKNYRNNPEQYSDICKMIKAGNVEPDDERDIYEQIQQAEQNVMNWTKGVIKKTVKNIEGGL